MITIVGTGHIFDLSEQVTFIIKHLWPDAVLVELDEARFAAMTDPAAPAGTPPGTYRRAAEYQRRMAAEYDTTPGAELITAVHAGRMIGAEVHFIDKHAGDIMERVWREMSLPEKVRYRMSNVKDALFSRKATVESALAEFAEDEDGYIEEMRAKYPTLVRIVMDERNRHMAGRINEISKGYGNTAVVMGDGHVEAVSRMLDDPGVKKIRLKDLMDRERMDAIRSELWNHKGWVV